MHLVSNRISPQPLTIFYNKSCHILVYFMKMISVYSAQKTFCQQVNCVHQISCFSILEIRFLFNMIFRGTRLVLKANSNPISSVFTQ